jgi:rSAM/selenodomain-associated transferase 2
MLSIVVPTWNEADRMAPLARRLSEVAPGAEVVVVDGGSDDGTVEAARAAGLRAVAEPDRRGRARQMNRGAEETRGELLLFLHADTALPMGVEQAVADALADPEVALGAFGLRLDRRSAGLRIIEAGIRIRNRLWRMPYGDQALFCRRETFEALGGYAELPYLEDPDLVVRARKLGRVVVLPQTVVTSARGWQGRSILAITLRNWWWMTRFRFGWRPRR